MDKLTATVCGDCGKRQHIDDLIPLHEVKNIINRMDPGGEVPAGECKACGSLAYMLYNQAGRAELRLDDNHVFIAHRSDEGVVLDVWEDGGKEAIWSTYFFDDEMMAEATHQDSSGEEY